MTKIETIYDANGHGGPGFYNILTTGSLQEIYGPYTSRPLARITASKFLVSLSDEEKELV